MPRKLSQAQRDALREHANLRRLDVAGLCAAMGSDENPRPFDTEDLRRAMEGKAITPRSYDWLCAWIEEHLRVRPAVTPYSGPAAHARVLGGRDRAAGERDE